MRESISAATLIIAIVSLSMTACGGGATGSSFERATVAKNEAVIYIYRDEDPCLSNRTPEVFLDDKSVGKLKNGGYLVFKVEPKVHTVKIHAGDNMDLGLYVDPGEGEERFVKWLPACQQAAGTETFMANVKEVEAAEGLSEISATRLSR